MIHNVPAAARPPRVLHHRPPTTAKWASVADENFQQMRTRLRGARCDGMVPLAAHDRSIEMRREDGSRTNAAFSIRENAVLDSRERVLDSRERVLANRERAWRD